MVDNKHFIQRIGLLALSNILVRLSSIIFVPIIAKNFSIEDYGLWSLINISLYLMPIFTLLGLTPTMVRFLSSVEEIKEKQECFYSIGIIIFFTNIIFLLLMFLFSESVAKILFNNEVGIVKLLSIIIFFESFYYLFINYFRTYQKIKKYAIFEIIKVIITLSLVSYIVLNGFGIYEAVIGLLIARIIIFFIMGLIILKEIGIIIPRFNRIKEYLSFGLPLVPSDLSHWMVHSSDRYMISFFLGATMVGYYSPSYTIGTIITMISLPILIQLMPMLSKFYDEKNILEVKNTIKISLKYYLIFSIPAVFALSYLSKPILMILTTSEIAQKGFFITPYIAVSTLLLGCIYIFSQVFFIRKKTKTLGLIWITGAIVNLIMNIFMIQYFGIIGAAISTLITFILIFVIITYFSRKEIKYKIDIILIIKLIVASVLMSLLIITWYPSGVGDLLILISICIITYFTLIYFLRVLTKEEIGQFIRIIKLK